MRRVLVACEESQTVCKAFRAKGFEAYSCDIQDCSGGHPHWHLKGDVLKHINKGWDLIIAHPPCTYLTVAGVRWLYNKDKTRNEDRYKKQTEALDFVRRLMNADCQRIAIENPVSVISSNIRKPDQIIQPWQFGHKASKSTCLWLKNLPLLQPTKIVEQGEFKEWVCSTTGKVKRQTLWMYEAACNARTPTERACLRSKTFTGVAEAMAEQWGSIL